MLTEMNVPTSYELDQAVSLYLERLPELSANGLRVSSYGGIITLEGFVAGYHEKRALEMAALEVEGVKAVVSGIVIKPQVERPDEDIARDLLHEFRSNVLIPGDQIRVLVSNGLVTVQGVVHSQFEKLLAEAAVKRVRGITGIRNEIEVKPEAFYPALVRGEEELAVLNNQGALVELGAAEAG